jgi:AcrR family transcriptional regulator
MLTVSSIRKNPANVVVTETASPKRRLPPEQRERLIVEGAVRFFSEHGLQGQLRDLAKSLGITHTLMYHYFPTKQALIERVYTDLFAARWQPAWETLLDDKNLDVETKLTRFYTEYACVILQRYWVRIFVFSGLSDRYITDRYFALLGDKLFPRVVRESRKYCGLVSRRKPTQRELELLMGLHGSIFYMGIRRWVYGHGLADQVDADSNHHPFDHMVIHDRVRGYLLALAELVNAPEKKQTALRTRAHGAGTKEATPWHFH